MKTPKTSARHIQFYYVEIIPWLKLAVKQWHAAAHALLGFGAQLQLRILTDIHRSIQFHTMDRYLSRRLLSAVCVGVGVCAGSLTQWIHSKPKRNDPMNDPCKCHSQCSLHNVSAASHEVAVVKKFQQWLPQVAASTIVTSGQYPQTPSNTGPQSGMTRFAVPEMKALIAYDDYVLHYDRRTRNAHWVFEHLTRERVKASEEAKREHSSFYEEPNIHPFFRSMNEDFKGSGFDRGHLAAAGNHRWSQQAMNQTFSLGNISPQVNSCLSLYFIHSSCMINVTELSPG